jgi:LTXXQ motif family protein
MRTHGFCILATVALVSPALISEAAAQMHRGGGGGGGGAPAPHFSAPAAAPRMSAPAMAPRMSAPAPHFSAPAARFAAPTPRAATPHFSAPHVATPRVVTPRVGGANTASPRGNRPDVARRNAGVNGPAGNRLNRNALAPSAHRAAQSTDRARTAVGNGADRGRGRNATTAVGQGPAGPGRNAANALQTTRQGREDRGNRIGDRGNHILRNAALANLSTRNPAARALSDSTFRGHFAESRFARDFDRDRRHRHFRHLGFVLGFAGPVFWPYAYDDFVDYTFWPAAYDTFWPYAYDDVFVGLYGGYAPEYGSAYAYAGTQGSRRAYASRGSAAVQGGATTQICSGDARGLTDFPIEQIARQVQPTPEQQKLLDDLKAATEKAVQILQTACPNDLPATPTVRIDAMRTRVQAMLDAVRTVRPALERFYASLTDEQKERFNALDQGVVAANAQGRAEYDQFCGRQKPSAINLPIDRIERTLRLNETQEAALRELEDATAKAADVLNSACPTGPEQEALTPPGRVATMELRLQAMLQAIDTVQPALEKFYTSLNDEQKARFVRLGRRTT